MINEVEMGAVQVLKEKRKRRGGGWKRRKGGETHSWVNVHEGEVFEPHVKKVMFFHVLFVQRLG